MLRVDLREFARGLREVLVVEEKRAFLELFAKDVLYGAPDRPRIVGKRDEEDRLLTEVVGELDPDMIAHVIAKRIARRLRIESVDDHRHPAFTAALKLYDSVFPEKERIGREYFVELLAEKRLGLLEPFNLHFLVARKQGRVVGLATASYLAVVNMGFVGYLAVDPQLKGARIGSRLRARLVAVLRRYPFVRLPGDVYFIERLPVRPEAGDFIAVVLAALTLCLAAALYPAWRASKLDPVDAIRRQV